MKCHFPIEKMEDGYLQDCLARQKYILWWHQAGGCAICHRENCASLKPICSRCLATQQVVSKTHLEVVTHHQLQQLHVVPVWYNAWDSQVGPIDPLYSKQDVMQINSPAT